MLHVVEDQAFARSDETGLAVPVGTVDQPNLGGLVIADRDGDEGGGLREADMDEPARLRLLVDQLVPVGAVAEAVAHDAHGAMMLVDGDVVEGRGIRRPDDLAGGGEDFVGKIPAVGEVAHAHREELGALRVGRPGQKAVIG